MKSKLFFFATFFWTAIVFSQEAINTNTTICWDVSTSMAKRNLKKDLSILEKVFERNKNQEVQLLFFSIGVKEKNYTIVNGNWQKLKTDLENSTYDGATIYSVLDDKIKNPNVYVFTDGHKILSKDVLSLPPKSYLINSNADRNNTFLERTALLTKSRLMDFAAILPQNVEKKQLQKQPQESNKKQFIKGTVYVDNKPTSNVRITVKGISDSFITGTDGGFTIDARVGDTLVATSRTNRTIRAIPIETMGHINIFMDANVVDLDEVVLVEKELEQTEAVRTGYGLTDKKKLGYTVSQIESNDISAVQTTVSQSINTKVSGLRLGRTDGQGGKSGLEKAEIRGRNTISMNPHALVIVNGVPLDRTNTRTDGFTGASIERTADYDFIDPNNIENITVLKGLAATNIYGSEGANGVILITTKTAVGSLANQEKKDLALVQNNVYNEEEVNLISKKSSEFIGFDDGVPVTKNFERYLSSKKSYKDNIEFYLAAYNFFKEKDPQIAKGIVSNILEHPLKKEALLKLTSLALSAVEDHKNVIRLNDELIEYAPNDVNAYFNKALAKKKVGRYQEALNELLALAYGNTYFSVDASGISKTLDREIKNLIFQHKSKLNTLNLEQKYLSNIKYKVRLVFEWNIPGAEFELQFVNPKKRFFNWEHTNTAIKKRIEDEIKNNYRVEEYEFYGNDVTGEWIINAKYLGDTIEKNEVPLVLKCTIFKDFGQVSQSKEEVLVYFFNADEKKNIKNLLVD